mmetsp:Transcript_3201/g.4519  ORF Transcript_3201/g.4519 Transcript_3201/m.4519 type:complete len:370 (+) Transcript_3201:85-1194(+)|eukprot:CAMPEP_0117744880 /NCGR_PEP_ID=MMETSP0947-20121206/7026_1 /TAXON_ID=44440 /ORGANISM="Chattonella subsalsa, Strain CCMP2191" /LENGTH=369 /DNA_ID=CAMNT_0005561921 /DNA_START=66 /DNA_END=1175 /DNA_ORIENTATION=-
MAHNPDEQCYAFVAEWYDPMPQLTKQYLLKYFPETHEVEMVDGKSRRMFLKRSKVPETILPQEFFVGSRMVLYARNLNLVDYGDSKTRKIMSEREVKTLIILGPDVYEHFGKILDAFTQQDLTIGKIKMFKLGISEASDVCSLLSDQLQSSRDAHVQHLSSNVGLAVLLLGDQALDRCQQIADSVRSRYAADSVRNAVTCCGSENQVEELTEYFFGPSSRLASTATFDNCTCCVIRPHAVNKGLTGRILDDIISQGYEVSALEGFTLERPMSEEFLEVYKGVVPEYPEMVNQLCSGACVALEVRAEDAVNTFRQTAGPWDVEMAKELRPNTIRAKYGLDRILNAVHCTDLPEDGISECQYFFDLMQRHM